MYTDPGSEKLVCNSLLKQRQLEEQREASKPHIVLQTVISASSPAAASCCYNVSPQQPLEGSHGSESGEEWAPQIKEIIKKKILQKKLMNSPDEVTCYLRGNRQNTEANREERLVARECLRFSTCEEIDIKNESLKKGLISCKFWANYSLSLQFH